MGSSSLQSFRMLLNELSSPLDSALYDEIEEGLYARVVVDEVHVGCDGRYSRCVTRVFSSTSSCSVWLWVTAWIKLAVLRNLAVAYPAHVCEFLKL
jgi:hypothetical protein